MILFSVSKSTTNFAENFIFERSAEEVKIHFKFETILFLPFYSQIKLINLKSRSNVAALEAFCEMFCYNKIWKEFWCQRCHHNTQSPLIWFFQESKKKIFSFSFFFFLFHTTQSPYSIPVNQSLMYCYVLFLCVSKACVISMIQFENFENSLSLNIHSNDDLWWNWHLSGGCEFGFIDWTWFFRVSLIQFDSCCRWRQPKSQKFGTECRLNGCNNKNFTNQKEMEKKWRTHTEYIKLLNNWWTQRRPSTLAGRKGN